MAKFKGTNGDDTITGSSFDDTIVPLLGKDTVDGGAGYDSLTIDYSSLVDAYWISSMQLQADGSWTGATTGGSLSAQNYCSFSNVEQIKFTATQANDYLTVDLGTLTPDKSRLNLDGSGGDDILSVIGVELTKRLTLVTAADGSVKANFAALAGWDAYDISLGLSAGNNLVLGGGDDTVSSNGGQDKIDGAGGRDSWTGYYQSRTDDLNVFISTGIATVDGAAGRLADLKNVEVIGFQGGSGDDTVTAYGVTVSLNGGDGQDSLALNPFGAGAPMRYEVYQANAAILAGQATELGSGAQGNFYGFEDVVLGGSEGADQFVVDLSKFQAADIGFSLYLAARGGADSLILNLGAQGQTSIENLSSNAGSGYVNVIGDSNHIDWSDVETANVTLGAGDDVIDFNVAATALTLDGGAGLDTIDFDNASGGVYFDLNATGASTVFGVSITASNIEGLSGSQYVDYFVDAAGSNRIRGQFGDDTVRLVAASGGAPDTFDGGAGFDTIDYGSVTGAVTVSLAVTAAQNTGGAGTETLTGFERVYGSIYNDTLTGSAGDDSLNGYDGNDVLEGGAGNDTLYGGTGIDTASYAGAGAAVTVALIAGDQNTGGAGTDWLALIENLTGSAFGDTLTGDGGANRLTGGRGADVLNGGAGADVFAFISTLDSTASDYDRVNDFSRTAGDKIDLWAIDAISTNFVRNDAFSWIGTDAFHGVAGELREIAVRGGGYFLFGDTNGDKVADLAVFVNSTTALVAADIVL